MVSNIFSSIFPPKKGMEHDGTMIKFHEIFRTLLKRTTSRTRSWEWIPGAQNARFFLGGTFCGIGTSKFGAQKRHLAVLGVFHWEILLGKWRSKMGLWAIGQLLSFWDLRSTPMEFWVDFTIKSKPCQGGRSKPVVLVQFIAVGVCWGVFKGGSWEFHKCLANIIQSETDSAVQACRGWENKAGFDLSLSLKPKVCTGTFHIMRLKSWYLLNMIWWTTPQDMPNLIIILFSDNFQCFAPGTNSAPIRGKVVYEALWLWILGTMYEMGITIFSFLFLLFQSWRFEDNLVWPASRKSAS